MTKRRTDLASSSPDSEMAKLRRDKFALLARVGQRKREASQFREEAEFYCGNVTELLALLAEAMQLLREMSPPEEGNAKVADLTSKHIQLVGQLLSFWPSNLESQNRVLSLLDSPGLGMVTGLTKDGFVIPSSALILESVARAIAVTKEENQKQSSD